MIINILCSCQSSSLRILRSFFGSSRRRPYEWAQQLAAKRTRTIDQIAYENFPSKNFKPFAPSAYPLRPLTNHCAGRCPAHCFVGGLKWTQTIDWKVKRFSAKISKAFDIVAVDVCPLSRNNLSNATSLRLLNYWWAQMDSNHRLES